MQIVSHTIDGIDGSQAHLTGYVLDNSEEIDIERVRPAVLILPGGGFAMVSDREAEPIATQFVAAGYHAFVLRYAVAPSRYPTALLQTASAMQYLREHAQQWHIKPNAIAIVGFSAGGHLAANLATSASDILEQEHGFEPDSVRPNALILAYPVISARAYTHRASIDRLLNGLDDNLKEQLLDELSLQDHVDQKTPPVFVWQTITDPVVPVQNSLMFINACINAGVSVEAHLYPKGGHGLALANSETTKPGSDGIYPNIQQWIHEATDWIQRTLS